MLFSLVRTPQDRKDPFDFLLLTVTVLLLGVVTRHDGERIQTPGTQETFFAALKSLTY